jgi:hypothetical protein
VFKCIEDEVADKWLISWGESSDVVQMASYAPLFVNVNDRRYAPNHEEVLACQRINSSIDATVST